MASGTLIFSGIHQLPDNWWNDPPPSDPASVWNVWDKDTFYTWGANAGNYQGIAIGKSLNGGGMASPTGPSRGMAHPHYVGLITMNLADMPKNDAVFLSLESELGTGKKVVIPFFKGRFSLGTGIGANVPRWAEIQKYLLEKIYGLGQKASATTIPPGTFWPDCRTKPEKDHPIRKLDDLMGIVDNVLT